MPSWMVLGWITLYRQPSEVARYTSLKKLTCYHKARSATVPRQVSHASANCRSQSRACLPHVGVDLSGCFRFYDSVTDRIEDDSRTGAGANVRGKH